ncbi:hypothetical protein HDU76_009120, partial [Blyttiomyces sp. JEL0837]
ALSRGTETIRDEDFDEPDCSVIGRHGYCTQVSTEHLFLIGVAISNVHDGDINLGGEGQDAKVLKGIKKTSQFGYLTLFEHYGSMKVGEYMKNPNIPIFVICSESHFTVLFSTDRDLLLKTSRGPPQPIESFDLFYYDGLAGQDSEIRLTVTVNPGMSKPIGAASGGGGGGGRRGLKASANSNETDLTPPLELVIRTRWPGCSVDWNGTEPLL